MQGVFIKYGEKEHLQQIVDGNLRFSPSQNYIKLEMEEHNKGQGDLLEGKWVIHAEKFMMESHDTHEVTCFPHKAKIVVGTVDVNDMPVFCISYYDGTFLSKNGEVVSLHLGKNNLEAIRNDFPKATHALILTEPEIFVNDVKSIEGHRVVSDNIHYYDYEMNDVRMLSYLTTGDEESYKGKGITLSMTYENRYRHLLCKDVAFSAQSEYRFIVTDQLVDGAVFYPFELTSKYLLVEISTLEQPIEI